MQPALPLSHLGTESISVSTPDRSPFSGCCMSGVRHEFHFSLNKLEAARDPLNTTTAKCRISINFP
jgi:hypothetical protein